MAAENASRRGGAHALARARAATRRYLARRGLAPDRYRLVKGWFNDTLTEDTRRALGLAKVSIAMIDCDIYSASRCALAFVAPLIVDDAVIFFDDWGWREQAGEIGQKEAFAEMLAQDPSLSAAPLPAYFEHARVFRVSRRP